MGAPKHMGELAIIIKAKNEEARIAQCIESVLRNSPPGVAVVIADSGSSDRTVVEAAKFPVQIATLRNASEASCGIAPQLGYQRCHAEFVMLMDGDMVLLPHFLEAALGFLAENPVAAGVAGVIVEKNLDNLEFKRRAARPPKTGWVDRLDGGGLYRRTAIEECGYLTDRNLHSYEEIELAARLAKRGWRLQRLTVPAVEHYGHRDTSFRLILQRWRSGYAYGSGEILRAGLEGGHLQYIISHLKELRLWFLVLAWWVAVLLCIVAPLNLAPKFFLTLVTLAIPFGAMLLKTGSAGASIYSVTYWCVNTVGMIWGFARPRKDPRSRIADVVVQ
jgi:glycosyltransferase involved in cell wall biosynthesis